MFPKIPTYEVNIYTFRKSTPPSRLNRLVDYELGIMPEFMQGTVDSVPFEVGLVENGAENCRYLVPKHSFKSLRQ